MINITIHEVLGAKWELDKDNPQTMPRTLVIDTLAGKQEITLFPVRDTRMAEFIDKAVIETPPEAA